MRRTHSWSAFRARRTAERLVASVALVAVVTAAIYVLREGIPVLGLGVLYLFAVLPAAVLWGLRWSIGVALGSMAAFNFLFLHPAHTFALADRGNWLVLAVYVVTAVVVSELAARSRRQAREASEREREDAILAGLSTALLEGKPIDGELPALGAQIARLADASSARVRLDVVTGDEPVTHQLVADGRVVGTLTLAPDALRPEAVRPRFKAALGSLLAVALDRERLAREAGAAEELRRSDALKTAVLRTVSHDLRTPLTAIRVAAEGLTSPGLELTDEDRSGLLATIQVEAVRLQRVVGDLLDLSRLEAGIAEPNPEVWTLEELLSQAVDGLSGAHRVRSDVASDALVRVDAVQVERVLANLVENALKFSPAELPVEVHAEVNGSQVVVHVVDHGPGTTREGSELFEPFRTGENGSGRGTGLGLAIARGFAEANAGRLWTTETPGGGATFSLALPAVEAPVVLSP